MADTALPTTLPLPDELVELGVKLCAVMQEEARLYAKENAPVIRLDAAIFSCVIDQSNSLPGYQGVWRDVHAQKCGNLIINSDGSFFGEFDVLILHPRKPGWFIESVTIWGRDGIVKAEPRLLAAV